MEISFGRFKFWNNSLVLDSHNFGDFINFSDPFFFISIFAAFAIQTKFMFSCDGIAPLNQDGFGKNWIYCASRFRKIAAEIKKYFLAKKLFHASFSSQLSRLSRFLKVLENRIRQYFITYNLKTWFILTRTKQNWPLKWKKKSLFIFVCLYGSQFFFFAIHASTARRTLSARHVLCTRN